MSQNITIDKATETDLSSIRMLLSELTDVMADTEGFDIEESVKNYRILLKDSSNYILIARRESNILGLINFTTRRTIMHPRPSGLIDEVIVSADSRGTGIGEQLISAVIDKCRELGCCEVEVSTEKSNTRARQFYKKCGFSEDAVILELDIEQ